VDDVKRIYGAGWNEAAWPMVLGLVNAASTMADEQNVNLFATATGELFREVENESDGLDTDHSQEVIQ
jgi:hypothetical protein